MSSKTKIVVLKLKDILFYATVAILAIIVILLVYILFQPEAAATSSTISVYAEQNSNCYIGNPHEGATKIEAIIG